MVDDYDFISGSRRDGELGVNKHGPSWWGRGSHEDHSNTDWDAVENALDTLETVPGMEDLVRQAESMADKGSESGFECPVCGLRHGHSSDKHDVRDFFGVTEEFADRMQYNPYCHCGVHELARLLNYFRSFEIECFEDEESKSFDLDKRRSEVKSAASSAPIPDSVRSKLNEKLGTA